MVTRASASESASPPAQPAHPALRRTLGPWQVAFSGVGVIMGAGIYALIGPAAGLAGNALWLAFVVAGVAAGLTAYTYARLGALQPKNSPEFQYTALAFGPSIGSIAGWQMLAADLLAAAAVALGFGGYLHHLTGVPHVAGSLALLAVITLVLFAGIAESVGLAMVLLVIDLLGLLFIVVLGMPFWPAANFVDAPQGLGGVWAAAALIFFAYLGFDEIGNFAEEMHEPERNLPFALLAALIMSTGIYLLVALSAVAAVGWRDLSQSEAPLGLVAGRALGPAADTVLSVMALAATSKTVLLLLVSGSRSVYGMAAAGVLPSLLARIGRREVPGTAVAVVVAISAFLLALGSLEQVAGMANATILFSFGLTNLALCWLVLRGRLRARGGRRLADITLPTLAVLVCGWLLLHTGPLSIAVAVTIAGVAVTASFLARRQDAVTS